MTQPGYIDYTRTSLDAGFLISVNTQTVVTTNVVFFTGYVAAWPYVTMSFNGHGSGNHYRVTLAWFTDAALLNNVITISATRDVNPGTPTQYPVIAPYLRVTVVPASTNVSGSVTVSLLGTTGEATSGKLQSVDTPIVSFVTSEPVGVGAITFLSVPVAGLWYFFAYAAAVPMTVELMYWNFGANTQNDFASFVLLTINVPVALTLPVPDAPLYIRVTNNSGGAANLAMYGAPVR